MTTTVNNEHEIGEYGKELWEYLTGRNASISYTFDNMQVEVPRRTGSDSPHANWRINGSVQITTTDNAGTR